ncbi:MULTISPECIES: hypothetical protein [unclassified Streptomyces]|uniref:hypothetical protein n=1 Tax=unclassified Streptomyces TaxID=2593676 RepID=UPI0007DD1438|nr:hypothetical protein [Streptomyces sp. SAT1]ANH92206.1 hypothetical protein A8713_14400 [Streptomyces sp. SAT1]
MIQQLIHARTTKNATAHAPATGAPARGTAPAPGPGIPARRAPEAAAGSVAVPHLMGLRMPADRPHRHKVPLGRLTAVAA